MKANELKKGSKIKIQGETVLVDSVCGNYVYYRLGEEYCWSFLYEITGGL